MWLMGLAQTYFFYSLMTQPLVGVVVGYLNNVSNTITYNRFYYVVESESENRTFQAIIVVNETHYGEKGYLVGLVYTMQPPTSTI